MPNIRSISDIRNYTEVLKEVRTNQPVYLTRNGRGAYAIVDMKELDDLQGMKAYIVRQFYEYLKKQFNEFDLHIILILSDHYYESVASMNEMGAAWVLQKKVYETFSVNRY